MSSGSPVVIGTPLDAGRVSRRMIVFVHGTWGRGFFPKPRDASLYPPNKRWWFEEGSQFRMRLDEALKAASLDWQIRAFLWSGANSVHARDCAARELSHQLTIDLQHPDAKAVIIAHSHGGNVALRALQRLDSGADRIKVVTLATPFLRVFARRSFQLPFAAQTLVYFAMFFLMMTFSFALEISMLDLAVDNKWISEEQASALQDWPFDVLFAVPGLFIAPYLIAFLSRSRVAGAIEEEASYDTRGAAASRMLVIRGVDDEASLSLAAGSIASGLSYFVLTWIFPGIALILLAAFILAVLGLSGLLLLFPSSGELLSDSVADWLVWVLIALLGICFCAPIFLILPGMLKSVSFGREFLVNGLVCDIAVDSVPDTLDQVEAITLKPASLEPGWVTYAFGLQVKPPPFQLSERRFSKGWWRSWWSEARREWRALQNPHSWSSNLRSWSSNWKWSPWRLQHGIYDHPDCVDEIVRWLRRVS